MRRLDAQPLPMPTNTFLPSPDPVDDHWVWDGYLARGAITLLNGRWKGGKTTLITGLLRHLSSGEPFLDRRCEPTTALVVSEESRMMWAARVRAIPVGPQVQLLSRPFTTRPTPDEWDELVRSVTDREAELPGLFVVDPLAMFVPGRGESSANDLAGFFRSLRWLTDRGAAVLVLHHPRNHATKGERTARGGRPLAAQVDILLDLLPVGWVGFDSRVRRLIARIAPPQTPPKLVYEWTPGTAEFRTVADPLSLRGQDRWLVLRAVLEQRTTPVTIRELRAGWPPDHDRPSNSQLYHWLDRAAEAGRVLRTGTGSRYDPYRFVLPDSYP